MANKLHNCGASGGDAVEPIFLHRRAVVATNLLIFFRRLVDDLKGFDGGCSLEYLISFASDPIVDIPLETNRLRDGLLDFFACTADHLLNLPVLLRNGPQPLQHI